MWTTLLIKKYTFIYLFFVYVYLPKVRFSLDKNTDKQHVQLHLMNIYDKIIKTKVRSNSTDNFKQL